MLYTFEKSTSKIRDKIISGEYGYPNVLKNFTFTLNCDKYSRRAQIYTKRLKEAGKNSDDIYYIVKILNNPEINLDTLYSFKDIVEPSHFKDKFEYENMLYKSMLYSINNKDITGIDSLKTKVEKFLIRDAAEISLMKKAIEGNKISDELISIFNTEIQNKGDRANYLNTEFEIYEPEARLRKYDYDIEIKEKERIRKEKERLKKEAEQRKIEKEYLQYSDSELNKVIRHGEKEQYLKWLNGYLNRLGIDRKQYIKYSDEFSKYNNTINAINNFINENKKLSKTIKKYYDITAEKLPDNIKSALEDNNSCIDNIDISEEEFIKNYDKYTPYKELKEKKDRLKQTNTKIEKFADTHEIKHVVNQYKALKSEGVADDNDRVKLLKAGVYTAEYRHYKEFGITDIDKILNLKSLGLKTSAINGYNNSGITDIEDMIELRNSYIDYKDVQCYKDSGVKDAKQMIVLANKGFSGRLVKEYNKAGINKISEIKKLHAKEVYPNDILNFELNLSIFEEQLDRYKGLKERAIKCNIDVDKSIDKFEDKLKIYKNGFDIDNVKTFNEQLKYLTTSNEKLKAEVEIKESHAKSDEIARIVKKSLGITSNIQIPGKYSGDKLGAYIAYREWKLRNCESNIVIFKLFEIIEKSLSKFNIGNEALIDSIIDSVYKHNLISTEMYSNVTNNSAVAQCLIENESFKTWHDSIAKKLDKDRLTYGEFLSYV